MKSLYYSNTVGKSLKPQSVSGSSAVNGSAVNKLGYDDAMAVVRTGSASGSPTSFSFAFKVQECATSNGTYTDVSGATATMTTEDAVSRIPIPDMHNRLQYLRVVVTPTFVGGTSPAVPAYGDIVLGSAKSEAVS